LLRGVCAMAIAARKNNDTVAHMMLNDRDVFICISFAVVQKSD